MLVAWLNLIIDSQCLRCSRGDNVNPVNYTSKIPAAYNTFLVCQDDFKDAVISAELNGLLFDENLAQLFHRIV
jgi:hypothetical protein